MTNDHAGRDRIAAWRPRLPGVAEVFHARWHDHAYPPHTHDTWTLLILDAGEIGFDLARDHHAAPPPGVTLLPPYVAHDGRTVTPTGFGKRVIYLDVEVLGEELIGRAVDRPTFADPTLRAGVSALDRALVAADLLEAESGLALVTERLRWHLAGRPLVEPERVEPEPVGPAVARLTRERLDADPFEAPRLADVAAEIGVSVPHLVRSFSREFGISPHRYVVGRRLDAARRRLIVGESPADVAVATGFDDQAHLTRHFRQLLRTTPGRYQRSTGLTGAGARP